MERQRHVVLRADPPSAGRHSAGALVARDAELAILIGELEASGVAGRSVVVGGDAGTGKTALLKSFLSVARRTGTVVIEGACDEIEARRPFGAFVDVLASCSRTFGQDRVERSLREHGVELTRLMTRDSNTASVGRTGQDRHLMHGSFLGLIEDLAADGPLILALEDIHWADEASLELWGYLSRRMRTRPFLLVATYRTDELGRLHPLRGLLSQLITARAVSAVTVAPLDLEGTGSLIRSRLALLEGSGADLRRFRDLLHEKCEGNPLRTEETLDVLRQSGHLSYVGDAWTCDADAVVRAIPPTIADGVIARWSALSKKAQGALLTASVAGHRFDPELVRAISGEPPAEIAAAVREAIDARLVLPERDNDDDHLFFRHALTREAISRQLLGWERRELHGKIAAFLELRRRNATVTASELAYHFDESGQKEPARSYHEEAAEEAAAALAFASATRHLERAIELRSDEGSDSAHQYVRLAQYLRLSGDDARAARAASTAVEHAERSGDAVALGQGLQELWAHHHWRGERERRDLASARAVQALEPLGATPQLAMVLIGQCWAAFERGDGAEVLRLAERALEIDDVLGLVAERAMPLNSLGSGLFLLGRSEDSVAPFRAALAIAREAGLVDETHWPWVSLRVALAAINAPLVEQQRVREEHRAFMRQHGLAIGHWISLELADRFVDGDWDGFVRLAPELEEAANPVAFREKQLLAAFVATARSGPDAVPDLEIRGLVRADTLTGVSAFWSAALLLLAGRAVEAVLFADGIHEETVHLRLTNIFPAARAHAIGLFAALRTGDQQAIERFERSLLETNSPPALAVTDEIHHALARASIAERGGAIDRAIEAYGEALDALDRERYCGGMVPYLASLTRLRIAELHVSGSAGGTADAQTQLDALLPFWRRANATWYLAQLRDWALGNGLAFPEQQSPDHSARSASRMLTQREHQVAMLVAQGLTNREIGERLSLSARTAESHVEHIRSKLGFHARSQIATWVTERFGARSK